MRPPNTELNLSNTELLILLKSYSTVFPVSVDGNLIHPVLMSKVFKSLDFFLSQLIFNQSRKPVDSTCRIYPESNPSYHLNYRNLLVARVLKHSHNLSSCLYPIPNAKAQVILLKSNGDNTSLKHCKSQRLTNAYKFLPGLLSALSSLTSSFLLSPLLIPCFSDMPASLTLGPLLHLYPKLRKLFVRYLQPNTSFKSLLKRHLHNEVYPVIFNIVTCHQFSTPSLLILLYFFFPITFITFHYIICLLI